MEAEGGFRPFAAFHRHFPMLRCGLSKPPFVHSAAFFRLKRQCAGPSVFSLRLGKWLSSEGVPKTVVVWHVGAAPNVNRPQVSKTEAGF
jgi:hypothetical protein